MFLNSLMRVPYNFSFQHRHEDPERAQQVYLRQLELPHRRHVDELDINNYVRPPLEYRNKRQELPKKVKVELYNQSLWKLFYAETTEMIITKNGRRMFPSVEITVSGLEKESNYCIFLELGLASNRRQKYVKNTEEIDLRSNRKRITKVSKGWVSTSHSEQQPDINQRILVHPDSPAQGMHWMQQEAILFRKMKITNDTTRPKDNQIQLISMHKYRASIWIVMCNNVLSLKELSSYPYSVYPLHLTEFISVTAYQNEKVIRLKIEKNPFAKGFRKDGQSRSRKRCLERDNSLEEEENSSIEGKYNNIEKKRCELSEEYVDVTSLESITESKKFMNDSLSIDSSEFVNNYNNNVTSSNTTSNTNTNYNNDQNHQTRFHRPWADDNTNPPRQINSSFNQVSHIVPTSWFRSSTPHNESTIHSSIYSSLNFFNSGYHYN
ncbi:hypothetical protein M0802_011477 [Mischocyttarus mexicanus]|nr:hypothetical protein M0802_011477 [Mischocyttarus mexicanus]